MTLSLTAIGWEAPLEPAPRAVEPILRDRAPHLVGGGLQALEGEVPQEVARLGGAAVLGQAVLAHVGERAGV
ncbi:MULTISPECIES: hypothetical protein [unclassified Streptomyces]|uniref:hypothetical protein n=1 Tax=unclassified Streptomyces TaxID=2593676 RepID=UPI0036E2D017